MEVVRGSAMTREKGWEEEEGTNLLGSVNFVRECPQVQATPASDFVSLAADSQEEVEGKKRGRRGGLIGVARSRLRQGVTGN
jgi:hypothetical protein